MSYLYSLSIYIYYLLICIASTRNKKAKKWLDGRRKMFERISSEINGKDKIVWFHCASLGEFEQGRPVMEDFKDRYPEYKIILTFFSPSGYEVRKNYKTADYIYYLPMDTPRKAAKFIKYVNPEIVIFIKYEFWFNYLRYLNKNKIPVFIVSAVFRPGQHFFRRYGGWSRKQLKKITWFFVQNQKSKELLLSAGVKNVTVSGDTRFDRVFQIAKQDYDFKLIKKFKQNKRIFIAGSTWPPDEQIVKELINKNPERLKYIIAPHDVNKEHINSLTEIFGSGSVKLSETDENNVSQAKILIIDSIGILSKIYRHAEYSLIGGGFGAGIHNILEAATFGMPIFFGPNYNKFNEAKELVNKGIAYEINRAQALIEKIHYFESHENDHKRISEACKKYVIDNTGATKIIIEKIGSFLSVNH